jgi:hypothetical protein
MAECKSLVTSPDGDGSQAVFAIRLHKATLKPPREHPFPVVALEYESGMPEQVNLMLYTNGTVCQITHI